MLVGLWRWRAGSPKPGVASESVRRVLDIDLDFFVTPPVYWPGDAGRPDPNEYTVQPTDAALDFLRDRCGLVGRSPGFLTETHDQLFLRWRDAIARGILEPPFQSLTSMLTQISETATPGTSSF